MIDRILDSLTPVAYMAVGIVLALLSIAVGDRLTSAALLAASVCSVGLTAVKWGHEPIPVRDR